MSMQTTVCKSHVTGFTVNKSSLHKHTKRASLTQAYFSEEEPRKKNKKK